MAEGISIFSPPKSPATNSSPAVVEHRTAPVQSATSTTVQSSPDITPAQARWQATQDEIRRSDPWRDPNTILVKDPVSGTITAKPRVDGGQNGVPQPEGQPQPGQAVVADGKLRVGQYELSETDIGALLERKSLEESRKLTVPTSADGYKFDLPSDFKMPDGVTWAWDEGHPVQGPLLARAREFAHGAGLSQDQFSQMLSFHVANEVQQQQVFNRAKLAELDKLGSLGPARIDAVRAWVRGMTGDSAPELLRVLEAAPMASTITAFEKRMSRWSSQGAGGSPSSGRDGGEGRGPLPRKGPIRRALPAKRRCPMNSVVLKAPDLAPGAFNRARCAIWRRVRIGPEGPSRRRPGGRRLVFINGVFGDRAVRCEYPLPDRRANRCGQLADWNLAAQRLHPARHRPELDRQCDDRHHRRRLLGRRLDRGRSRHPRHQCSARYDAACTRLRRADADLAWRVELEQRQPRSHHHLGVFLRRFPMRDKDKISAEGRGVLTWSEREALRVQHRNRDEAVSHAQFEERNRRSLMTDTAMKTPRRCD
jgi:hypothetical protein